LNQTDDSVVDRFLQVHEERYAMHDLLIALAFIGMVIAPAIVAANASQGTSDDSN
jgi:hypothetical protein